VAHQSSQTLVREGKMFTTNAFSAIVDNTLKMIHTTGLPMKIILRCVDDFVVDSGSIKDLLHIRRIGQR
jgi:hypothetical protein